MKYFAAALLLYCLIALYRTPTSGYGAKILLFLDLGISALIWRMPDITISSMCGLALRNPNPPWWARAVSAFCNLFEANHCELAIEGDKVRASVAIVTLTSGVAK